MFQWFFNWWKARAWDRWIKHHITTCETCRAAFEDMSGGMCEEAFEKMQEFMRKNMH